jgi:hypothetical protein
MRTTYVDILDGYRRNWVPGTPDATVAAAALQDQQQQIVLCENHVERCRAQAAYHRAQGQEETAALLEQAAMLAIRLWNFYEVRCTDLQTRRDGGR